MVARQYLISYSMSYNYVFIVDHFYFSLHDKNDINYALLATDITNSLCVFTPTLP